MDTIDGYRWILGGILMHFEGYEWIRSITNTNEISMIWSNIGIISLVLLSIPLILMNIDYIMIVEISLIIVPIIFKILQDHNYPWGDLIDTFLMDSSG